MPPVSFADDAKLTCCLLTAAQRGAVAVVAVAGGRDRQTDAINRLFQPIGTRPFKQLRQQNVTYGRWLSTAEDLVVVRVRSGFEVHCHGGTAAAAAIIRDLEQCGFDRVDARRWGQQFATDWQVDTETALTRAPTRRTARHLIHALNRQMAVLTEIKTLIETDRIDEATDAIEQTLKWAEFGIRLTEPARVVLCGQPNAGKSSLINAMVGFQRAIVSETAGTTRDVVSQTTAIDGWPVHLLDTAGLRTTTEQIEKLGIEQAKKMIAAADVRVGVIDCSTFDSSSPQQRQQVDELVAVLAPQILVHNKIDLVTKSPPGRFGRFQGPAIDVSALTGHGMEQLVDAIATALVPEVPTSEQWLPVSKWQVDRLQSILHALARGDTRQAIAELPFEV